jgi:hypothetical protein
MLSIIVTLAFIAFIVWLVQLLIPMDGKIRQVFYGVVCLVVCIWLLNALGVLHGTGIRLQ